MKILEVAIQPQSALAALNCYRITDQIIIQTNINIVCPLSSRHTASSLYWHYAASPMSTMQWNHLQNA